MAFADHISGATGIMWYCRISGIPYVFHNATNLPSAWRTGDVVTIDSESYTQSPTLTMRDGLTITQEIAPKQGLAKSGGQTFKFLLDSLWLDLTAIAPYRSGSPVSHVIDDLAVDDSTLGCDVTTAWDAAGDVYAGPETMTYASHDGSDFTISKRGAYNSQPLPIRATGLALSELGTFGCVVSNHPTVWHDRVLQLWCATGTWQSDGSFAPNGATIESAEDQRVFQGVINGLAIERDSQHVTIKTQPLDVLLDRQVGRRLPKLLLGTNDAGIFQAVGYDDSNSSTRGIINVDGETVVLSSLLSTSASFPSVLSVPDIGKYVAEAMTSDILAASASWLTAGSVVFCSTGTDADGVLFLNFGFRITAAAAGTFFMSINATPDSVWRLLGFEGDQWVSSALTTGANSETFTLTADRPLPSVYLANTDTLGTLWWTSQEGPDYEGETEWRTRTNGTISAHVLVGEEVITVGESSVSTRYGVDYTSAPILSRGALGTKRQELYVERGDGQPEGIQGIGLPGSYVADAWLYLMCGGSGTLGFQDFSIDRGWIGSGAYIDIDLVDTASFDALRADRRWISSNLGVFKSERLREVMQGDIIGQAYAIVSGADQIRAVDIIPPTISDVSAAVMALDHTNTRTIGAAGIGVDTSERRIVNRVEILAGRDNATDEWLITYPASHTTSIGTYGEREPLRMLLRSQSAAAVSDAFAIAIAESMFAAWGTPYAILEVEVTDPFFWAVKPGEIVTITNEVVPTVSNGISLLEVGRGISLIPARLMVPARKYPRSEVSGTEVRGVATLVIPNISGAQTAHWSPTMKCTAIATATLTITAAEYSAEGSSTVDADRVAAGDSVYLRTYDGGTYDGPYEVGSVTGNSVVLTTTPLTPPTAPFLVEAVKYSHASIATAQRAFAFQATAHKLTTATGTGPPRVFR